MRLRYNAVSQEGKRVRGIVEAKESKDAAYYLRQRNLVPVQIAKEKEIDFFKKIPGLGRVKSKDVVLFTRQISSMLASGLTLIKSLEILKDQINNKTLRETIGGSLLDLEEGKTFSESISKYPDIFSPVYISLVKAGEVSGLLDKVFLRLANNLEDRKSVV